MKKNCSAVVSICMEEAYDRISSLIAKEKMSVCKACRQVADDFNKDNPGAGLKMSNLRRMYYRTNKQKNSKPKLYILSCGNNYYKIGITNNVEQRVAQLQVGNPLLLLLEYVRPIQNPAKIEKTLHKALNKYHVRGEWFSFTEEEIISVVKLIEALK